MEKARYRRRKKMRLKLRFCNSPMRCVALWVLNSRCPCEMSFAMHLNHTLLVPLYIVSLECLKGRLLDLFLSLALNYGNVTQGIESIPDCLFIQPNSPSDDFFAEWQREAWEILRKGVSQ